MTAALGTPDPLRTGRAHTAPAAEHRSTAPVRVCAALGCDRTDEHGRLPRGWCGKHYQRWRKTGRVDDPRDSTPLSYGGVHDRLRAAYGPASDYSCVACCSPAAQWAYDHSDPDELRGVGGSGDGLPYSLDLHRYHPLCWSCHQGVDARPPSHCRRGHRLGGANRRASARGCLACSRAGYNARCAKQYRGEVWTEEQFRARADEHYARIMVGAEEPGVAPDAASIAS